MTATSHATMGARIRARREALGLSCARYAELAGVSPDALRRWEAGTFPRDHAPALFLVTPASGAASDLLVIGRRS